MRCLDGITHSMDMSLSKLGDGEGQGSLAYCSSWGHKQSETTERLNKNNTLFLKLYLFIFDCVGSLLL